MTRLSPAIAIDHLPMIVLLVVMAALPLVLMIAVVLLMRPWLMAFLSGCPMPAARLVAMKLRRADAQTVVECGIMATQAGCPIAWDALERAEQQGVDLRKVTLAYIKARREHLPYSFEALVDADRNQQLEQLLERE